MAMNFSSCSLLPTAIRPADNEFGAPMRHQGTAEGYGAPYWPNWEGENSYVYEGAASRDGSYDPADLLPSDPFGMELPTFTAAIAGWMEDFGVSPGDFEVREEDFVAGLSYYWNEALASSYSRPDWGSECLYDYWIEREFLELARRRAQYAECSSSVGAEVYTSSDGDGSVPHEGLFYALGHLGLQDLLSMQRVCRSLHSAVQNDTLLWRCIHLETPLSERITDDDLLRLTQRSQGYLQCLSLVGCPRITDEGLKRVLMCNPKLKKLGVSGCVRLSIEGLIHNLKSLKSSEMLGIKHLKLGRLFSVSPEQYEELEFLVAGDGPRQPKAPRFYHVYISSPPTCDDKRSIDIEFCPGCQKFKLVFDCPSESCQGKGANHCRACEICISRCVQCGICINNRTYVETFCLDYLCSSCWHHVPSQSPKSWRSD